MLKSLVGISAVIMLVSCGRSSTYVEKLVNVKVGLVSTTGSPLNGDGVATALQKFEFELTKFSAQPVCISSDNCHWAVDGVLPGELFSKLQAYEDVTLKVVFVHRKSDQSLLPSRN